MKIVFYIVAIFIGILVFSNDSSGETRKFPTLEPTVTATPTPYYFPSSGGDSGSSFNGYPCTDDCSGHEAGYEWAQENDIDDEYDCDGNSDSFNEGCQSYVEENYSENDYEEDSDYYDY